MDELLLDKRLIIYKRSPLPLGRSSSQTGAVSLQQARTDIDNYLRLIDKYDELYLAVEKPPIENYSE